MATTRPYYRRHRPAPKREEDFASDGLHVDFSRAHLPPYGSVDAVADAVAAFDDRTAAVIRGAIGIDGNTDVDGYPRAKPDITWEPLELPLGGTVQVPQDPWFVSKDLTEFKWYGSLAPTVYLARSKCLAVMAYEDYFPQTGWAGLRAVVSAALLAAGPGWCGTFGPGVDAATDLAGDPAEGNYDMNQQALVPLAYCFYDDLPAAREHLITVLLKRGRIHRPRVDDTFTSGPLPNDWGRAGFVSPLGVHVNIGETENHLLMMLSTRYLTNQLLFQRDHERDHDNRRNGGEDYPSCLELVLILLKRILRGDFSEYNAKGYQKETRWALLNLCSYAYDHEVRLAARMVLDYVSAHIAVSTSDMRRMVPFRRRNEGKYVERTPEGFMDVGLLENDKGADPLTPYFAVQSGNLRAYEHAYGSRPWPWSIEGSNNDLVLEMLSDYRLPPSIHDLFVNDLHRRFFQRLHRTPRPDEVAGNRNADNMEIYAGSPSYLITAGGAPADYAIDPRVAGIVIGPAKQKQQLGVAVTTSFMPTGKSAGLGTQNDASSLIQFSSFSEYPAKQFGPLSVANYGVAPDFACGHQVFLPSWVNEQPDASGFRFVDRGSAAGVRGQQAGFYLALRQVGSFALLEALDTWLHPEVEFGHFRTRVLENNGGVHLASNVEFDYTTYNGNRLRVVIWNEGERLGCRAGARVLSVVYGPTDKADGFGDAGNVSAPFLSGTVMRSKAEGVVEVDNYFLGTRITLDMDDIWHPRRTVQTTGGPAEVEQAGFANQVWTDFDWTGPAEGDACHPYKSLSAATTAVANGGTVRMIPSISRDRSPIRGGKYMTLEAPLGDVVLGRT